MAGARLNAIENWLRRAPPAQFSAYAIAAAFSAYFCMYAFRKPFAAATFEGEGIGPFDLKTALVISQIVGYALSKFLSIKYVTELSPRRRAAALVVLIGTAELALLAFGALPPRGKVVAIFCNGVPLGAVWGLVFGFLEGRRTSEILGAGLSTSYIVASGAVKSVGRMLLEAGIPQGWMPFCTGLLFMPPFLLAVFMLRLLPPPTLADETERTHRQAMRGRHRIAFVRAFAPGLVTLTALYMLLTAYRDFRDNFAAEIWTELGYGAKPAVFTYTEIPIALCVMLALAFIYRIRDNRTALCAVHWLMLAGSLLVGLATLAFDLGLVGAVPWMVLVGTGLYLGYVPYGCVLFDRLIAATAVMGTAVFMIYVTDAFGYLGSILIMLLKNSLDRDVSWLAFFRRLSYVTSGTCTAAFAVSLWYFSRRTVHARSDGDRPGDSPA